MSKAPKLQLLHSKSYPMEEEEEKGISTHTWELITIDATLPLTHRATHKRADTALTSTSAKRGYQKEAAKFKKRSMIMTICTTMIRNARNALQPPKPCRLPPNAMSNSLAPKSLAMAQPIIKTSSARTCREGTHTRILFVIHRINYEGRKARTQGIYTALTATAALTMRSTTPCQNLTMDNF